MCEAISFVFSVRCNSKNKKKMKNVQYIFAKLSGYLRCQEK